MFIFYIEKCKLHFNFLYGLITINQFYNLKQINVHLNIIKLFIWILYIIIHHYNI